MSDKWLTEKVERPNGLIFYFANESHGEAVITGRQESALCWCVIL